MSHTLVRPAAPPSRAVSAALPILAFAALMGCLVPILSGSFGLLFLFAALAAIAAVLLITHPHWGLLLILSLWFSAFSPELLDAQFLRIPYLVGALLLGPLVLRIVADRRLWVLDVREIRILVAIGALMLVSTWLADFNQPNLFFPELDFTQRKLIRFGSRLMFLVYFATFMIDRKRIEWTVWTILLVVSASAATSWNKVFTGDLERAAATFGFASNSNALACVCVFATAIVWFHRSDGPPGLARRVLWPLLVFLPLTAIASGSRGGLLQMLVLAVLILRDQRGGSLGRRAQSFVMVACTAVIVLMVVPESLLQRTVSYSAHSNAPGGESLQNRIRVLQSATELFASSPLIGIGPGNFEWMSRATGGTGDNVHNSYLTALTEGGVVVFGLYLALFGALFRSLRRIEREGRPDLRWLGKALRVCLVLLLVQSAKGDIWGDDPLYWILALSIAATALSFPGARARDLGRDGLPPALAGRAA